MKKTIRVATRSSNLALKQVDELMIYFPEIHFELIKMTSYGDKHKEISLLDNFMPDFFTRELDEAVLNETADIAVHSAKDLPYPLREGLSVCALTKAADASDSLVAKNNYKFMELPKGSKIGVSSQNRINQIQLIRSDLIPVSIRGTIEERIALIEQGTVDAVIVASCALERLGLNSLISEKLPFKTNPLQSMLAVITKNDRPDLKALFHKIDNRQNYGRVFLIGAGPGKPDLLTIKSDKILKQSDIILYDDLIHPELINQYAAEKIYVGKRKNKQNAGQDEIEEMLYNLAVSGKNVSRLKSGDSFIFGRGGEETRYLNERMVETTVIPGVTSSFGAAAEYNIPLTMRGISKDAAFLSAHYADQTPIKVPDNDTLIYYMGASKLRELSAALLDKGIAPAKPAALIYNYGFLDEAIEISNVKDLANSRLNSPIIIIISDCINETVRKAKILYTGLEINDCNIPLNTRFFHYPLIEIEELPFRKIENLNDYEAVVFTSKTAVRLFFKNYTLANHKIFAIGKATQKELEKYGYQVDFMPDAANSENLAALIRKQNFKSIFYPCSKLSDNAVQKIEGVKSFALYNVIHKNQVLLDLTNYNGVFFSSPSTVSAFIALYKMFPSHMLYYAIGTATYKKLLEFKAAKELIINVQTL